MKKWKQNDREGKKWRERRRRGSKPHYHSYPGIKKNRNLEEAEKYARFLMDFGGAVCRLANRSIFLIFTLRIYSCVV